MSKDLRRVLGFWDSVAIGIAAMIGAGIFVVSGIGTRIAGSAVIIAFIIAGVVALFNALSSAELAAAIPREGGTTSMPDVCFRLKWASSLAGFSSPAKCLNQQPSHLRSELTSRLS